jgi:hypothetical protein
MKTNINKLVIKVLSVNSGLLHKIEHKSLFSGTIFPTKIRDPCFRVKLFCQFFDTKYAEKYAVTFAFRKTFAETFVKIDENCDHNIHP